MRALTFAAGSPLRAPLAAKADEPADGAGHFPRPSLEAGPRQGCDVIVMAADPPRNRLLADLMWSQEPYRVRRRARVPVYLVPPS